MDASIEEEVAIAGTLANNREQFIRSSSKGVENFESNNVSSIANVPRSIHSVQRESAATYSNVTQRRLHQEERIFPAYLESKVFTTIDTHSYVTRNTRGCLGYTYTGARPRESRTARFNSKPLAQAESIAIFLSGPRTF